MTADASAQSAVGPRIGDLICGKYRITRLLGRGGMGMVFEAVHRVTQRRIALKWLLPELATSLDGRRRFIREARAASRLQHFHVVNIYDLDQDRGWLFLIMELLVGESLDQRLERAGRLPEQAGLGLLLPCIRAIAQAHAAGIVHRDLKPANIFLCNASDEHPEHAKILDFGISRMTNDSGASEWSLTRSGALMGTPYYMAPEQLSAQAVDHRADIYGFGVILYEAFSGRRPFAGESLGQLVLKIMSDTPTALHLVEPNIDARLSAAVTRALARDPGQRFQTMTELARALEPILATNEPRSRIDHPALDTSAPRAPAARIARSRPWASQVKRWQLGLTAIALLTLGGWAIRDSVTGGTPEHAATRAAALANSQAPSAGSDSVRPQVPATPVLQPVRDPLPAGALPPAADAPVAQAPIATPPAAVVASSRPRRPKSRRTTSGASRPQSGGAGPQPVTAGREAKSDRRGDPTPNPYVATESTIVPGSKGPNDAAGPQLKVTDFF